MGYSGFCIETFRKNVNIDYKPLNFIFRKVVQTLKLLSLYILQPPSQYWDRRPPLSYDSSQYLLMLWTEQIRNRRFLEAVLRVWVLFSHQKTVWSNQIKLVKWSASLKSC